MADAYSDKVHDALNRMRRAHDRGTGCHLTADMIHALSCSMLGQMWSEPDPRSTKDTSK
jgi:hypothetical protein